MSPYSSSDVPRGDTKSQPDLCLWSDRDPETQASRRNTHYTYIGDIVATMSSAENGPSTKALTSKTPSIVIRETKLEIPFEWKTDRFQLLSKIVSFDTARNRIVADDVIEQVTKGERVLVLSERKEHLDILRLCLKGRCEMIMITGEDTRSSALPSLSASRKARTRSYCRQANFLERVWT